MASLLLTIVGEDKPGLVELLSESIASHQGNWKESAMSHLAGQFAGIVMIDCPDDQLESLRSNLESLEQKGLKVTLNTTGAAPKAAAHKPMLLELVGTDKPGIVRDISKELAARNVNVMELDTELVPGAMSSELLFTAHAKLAAPLDLELDELQEALESIASDLMVDITLS